jgi:hypothetical protein
MEQGRVASIITSFFEEGSDKLYIIYKRLLIHDIEDSLGDAPPPIRKTAASDLNQVIRPPDFYKVEGEINLQEKRGPLKEWIVLDGPRREVGSRFRRFLATFTGNSHHPIYKDKIQGMCLGILLLRCQELIFFSSESREP